MTLQATSFKRKGAKTKPKQYSNHKRGILSILISVTLKVNVRKKRKQVRGQYDGVLTNSLSGSSVNCGEMLLLDFFIRFLALEVLLIAFVITRAA